MRRPTGRRLGRDQAVHAGLSPSLRSDQSSAGSERPLRLVGADDAFACASAVRKTQATDLSENGRARAAGGLPADRARHARVAARNQRLLDVRRADSQVEVGEAKQADLRRQQDFRSLRDHSNAAAAQALERAGNQTLRPCGQAIPRRLLPARRIFADQPHHTRGRRAVQDRRQGARFTGVARGLRKRSPIRR